MIRVVSRAREWLDSLDSAKRAAAIAAIEVLLTDLGLGVCATEHGKQLGAGLFEFRIRHDESVIRGKAGEAGMGKRGEVLLRIFCHAYGKKMVLLLGGYDRARRRASVVRTARSNPRVSDCARSSCARAGAEPARDGAGDASRLTGLTNNPIWAITYRWPAVRRRT